MELRAGGKACIGPRSRLLGPVRSLREGVGDGKDEVVSSPWRASVTQGWQETSGRGGGGADGQKAPQGLFGGTEKVVGCEELGAVAADPREAGRESPVSAAHGHRDMHPS